MPFEMITMLGSTVLGGVMMAPDELRKFKEWKQAERREEPF